MKLLLCSFLGPTPPRKDNYLRDFNQPDTNGLFLNSYHTMEKSSLNYCLFYYSCPKSPPQPSSAQPNLHSHGQSPHSRSCPWVIRTRTLTNPFPLSGLIIYEESPQWTECLGESGAPLIPQSSQGTGCSVLVLFFGTR